MNRHGYSFASKETTAVLRSEQGAFLLLLSIFLTALIIITALAIDGGRLYISSLKVQQAVDAGTLVGARNIASLTKTEVETLASQVTLENLLQNGFQAANITVDAVLDEETDTLRVLASHNVESMFFGKIVKGQEWHHTPAVASAANKKVAVMLVVDRTGSMIAEVLLPDGSRKTRMELLKDAAVNFSTYFGADDRVGMVSFSTDTQINYDVTQPYNAAAFMEVVNTFPRPAGATNIQIGILRGLKELMKLDDGWDLNMIILTDGNPNRNARDDRQEAGLINWAESTFGKDIDVPNNPRCRPSGRNREQRENFIAAQLAADLARQAGVRVFSIAFGSEENTTARRNRPWGTIDPSGTSSGILESFMRWLANDVDSARYHQDLPFFRECVPSYAQMGRTGETGIGLISSDAADVNSMLAQLGSNLTLRLIE